MSAGLSPNPGKRLTVEAAGRSYERWPVRTDVFTAADDLGAMIKKFAGPHLRPSDILFVSERVVAITQGRAFPVKDIHPSPLAKFLVKFVHKSPYGIGLGSPWTMELALREAGALRVLFAALLSAVTKPFGVRGVFYRVVGKNLNAIDGPCDYTLPPYNEYAKLGPADPVGVAKNLEKLLGVAVVIIDANDLGVAILGKSSEHIDDDFCKAVFRDNPLGQGSKQTPLAIVRSFMAT